ncbi:MAG: DUF1833 domain-containing protein [Hyphomonadaceae bacterium]|nr:DUF1833 domain-containing protein [Hyphomonadaceae bacterium]
MTGRVLSAPATAAIAAEETDEVFLVLVGIDHVDLVQPIRVVNNVEPVDSGGETYVGLPFEIELPDEGERPGEARLSVDNVDRRIVEALRTVQSAPTVEIKVVLASQPDVIEYELSGLTLRDTTYDVATVQGYLRYEDLSIDPVADMITPSRFPGLF